MRLRQILPLAALCVAAATDPAAAASKRGDADVTTARAALIARDPALASLELTHEHTFVVAGGRRVVRFAQTHAGLPVIARGASVVLDASGAPTLLGAARLLRDLPSVQSPAVDVARAADAARRVARVPFDAQSATLAWLAAERSARLVWTFYASAAPLPFAPLIAVDAQTGHVVLAVNAMRFDRAATVHAINPVTTPEPTEVVLEALPQGATNLTNDKLIVQNCIDKGTLSSGEYPIHACELAQLAIADAQGDFPYTYGTDPSRDTAPEDPYAEVAMFYHASQAYAYYTGIGMPELEAKPLNLLVNLRLPAGFETWDFSLMSDPSVPLEPYDNAFFTPDNPYASVFGFGPSGAGLWFGQGTFADFSYDGDVVYHEFGHAAIDRTIKLVPFWHLDSQGASVSPGAMNEGLADFFSSALAGDSKVGEYAAQNFQSPWSGEIRDLENQAVCPTNLAGEVHVDSTLFSGGLWSVRKSLPDAQRADFDAAVMTTLMAAPSGDLGYEDLAALITASIADSPLGKPIADALTKELTTRGVLPRCNRIREYSGMPLVGADPELAYAFVAPGNYSVPLDQAAPYTPGLFQVHLALAADTAKVRISIDDVPLQTQLWAEGTPYEPAILARFDPESIEFSYIDNLPSSNAGDPIALGFTRATEIVVPEGATDLYLMLVNLGQVDGYYTNLALTEKSAPKSTGGSAGTPSSGGSAGAAGSGGAPALDADQEELSPAGGCACRASSDRTPRSIAFLAAIFALLALVRRRVR